MSESFQTPEAARVSRQDVVDAYRAFSAKGIGDPAELDTSDPEVVKAHALYDAWIAQGDKDDAQDEERRLRHNLDKTMINIDAGFTGKTYLEDALDWLMQDAEAAEEIPGDTERAETRDLLAAAIKKVENLLAATK